VTFEIIFINEAPTTNKLNVKKFLYSPSYGMMYYTFVLHVNPSVCPNQALNSERKLVVTSNLEEIFPLHECN